MKKILLVVLLIGVLMAVTSPAMALKTWNLSASSNACVGSASFGNSGSGAFASNGSIAIVGFSGPPPAVTSFAASSGLTGGYGFNFASQGGSAFAHGTNSGFSW